MNAFSATAAAILFPGQGSQTPEMRDVVSEQRPELLEFAVQAVGEDPFPRAGEGTNFAQGAAENAHEIADAHDLVVANDNSPQQVVLSSWRGSVNGCTVTGRVLTGLAKRTLNDVELTHA
jgi:hypothetical protein